jgi:Zn-dependent protease with chaperone function
MRRVRRSAARRALCAVGLLVGFYVVALGALAGLAAVDVLLMLNTHSGTPVFAEGKVIGCTVVLGVPLVRGLAASRVRRDGEPRGVAVTPEQQLVLWARIQEIAAQVGTRPPTELRLINAVNAGVVEDTRMLGLLPGRRRLYLGVPLLVGLTARQLDSVLAHELGHFGNHDVRFAAAAVRGRTAVLAVANSYQGGRAGIHRPLRTFFAWYAELYLRLSQSVSRQQELAADRTAARIAGRNAAIAALRRLPELDAAYDFYLDRYATIGWDAGLLPSAVELFAGFRALLADPSRQTEFAAVGESAVANPGAADPYDSHPPIRQRIEALTALYDDPPPFSPTTLPVWPEPPALTLLHDAAQLCVAVTEEGLPPEAANKRRATWSELARETGRATLARQSSALLDTAATVVGAPVRTLAGLLDAIAAGWLDPIADALPKSEQAAQATGRAARVFAHTALRGAMWPLLCSALVEAGTARWSLTWARALHLEFSPGYQEAANAALATLFGNRPDTGRLRALLAGEQGSLSAETNTATASDLPSGL